MKWRSWAAAALLLLAGCPEDAPTTGGDSLQHDSVADSSGDTTSGGDARSDTMGADDGDSGVLPDTTGPGDTAVVADTETVDTGADTSSADTGADSASADSLSDTGDAGPFGDLAGLRDGDLVAALHARIAGHTNLGYSGEGTARELLFARIADDDGRLTCLYTGRTVASEDPNAPPLGSEDLTPIDTTPDQDCRMPDGEPAVGGCVFNTEHTWPRTRGAAHEPPEADLHHLFPTWDFANNERGSHFFGETLCSGGDCEWAEGGSEVGMGAGGTTVFEVRPVSRGDVARAVFYFSVRYEQAVHSAEEEALKRWHREDPVDDAERARNEAIASYQGNRNPFIDRPDFVDAVGDF